MKGTEFWTRIQAKDLATCATCVQVLFHVTTPGTVFDLGSQVVFSGIYFFSDRGLSTARAISKFILIFAAIIPAEFDVICPWDTKFYQ